MVERQITGLTDDKVKDVLGPSRFYSRGCRKCIDWTTQKETKARESVVDNRYKPRADDLRPKIVTNDLSSKDKK